MFLDEIKNLELRDLLQAWEDDFRGALDLTIYKNELEIKENKYSKALKRAFKFKK